MSKVFENNEISARLARTSGSHNNCGLNCMTHFLISKLEAGEIEDRENRKEYQELLRSFEEYYGLEPETLDFEALSKIIKKYPNPLDREEILAPVLRLHLKKVLGSEQETWNVQILDSGEIRGLGYQNFVKSYIAGNQNYFEENMIKSNLGAFSALQTQYQSQVADEQSKEVTNDEIEVAKKTLNNNFPLLSFNNPSQFNFERIIAERIKYMKEIRIQDKNDNKLRSLKDYDVEFNIDNEKIRIRAMAELIKNEDYGPFIKLYSMYLSSKGLNKGAKPPSMEKLPEDLLTKIEQLQRNMINATILKNRKDAVLSMLLKDAEAYWYHQGGYQKYLDSVSNLSKEYMISNIELKQLAKALGFDIDIYTMEMFEDERRRPSLGGDALIQDQFRANEDNNFESWKLELYHSGAHWEYLAQAESPSKAAEIAQEHNKFYSLSHRNKIKGKLAKLNDEEIINKIRKDFESSPNEYLDTEDEAIDFHELFEESDELDGTLYQETIDSEKTKKLQKDPILEQNIRNAVKDLRSKLSKISASLTGLPAEIRHEKALADKIKELKELIDDSANLISKNVKKRKPISKDPLTNLIASTQNIPVILMKMDDIFDYCRKQYKPYFWGIRETFLRAISAISHWISDRLTKKDIPSKSFNHEIHVANKALHQFTEKNKIKPRGLTP